jgi:hypothetical protein
MSRWIAVASLLLATAVPPATNQPNFPAPMPLAYYSFDGQSVSETSVTDQSGNGTTLTLENGAALRDSNCKFGQCMTPGMASNGRGLFTPSLDFGEYGGSVSFWAMIFTINDFDRILIKTRSNMSPTFQLSFHNTNTGANETASSGEQFALWRYRLRANVTDPSGTSSRDFIFNSASAAPFRGVWHHVALHLGPTSAKLYINGGVPQRFFHSQPITYNPDTSLPFVLGNNPSGLGDRKLVGRIDELRFFRNDQPDQELSQPFIMSSLIVDPGTPAPTPMGAPPTPATTPAATTTTTPTTTTTTIAPTTSTTTSTAPPNTTPTPRPTTTTTTTIPPTTRPGPTPKPTTTQPTTTTTTRTPTDANTSDAGSTSDEQLQSTTSTVAATSADDASSSNSTTVAPVGSNDIVSDAGSGGLSDTLTIAIAVTGAVVVLLAIVLALVLWRTRRARAQEQNSFGSGGSGEGGSVGAASTPAMASANVYGVVPPAPTGRDGSASPTPSPPPSESNNYTSLRPKAQATQNDMYLTLDAVPTAYGVAQFV